MPVGAPLASRRTSKTENGRRSSGSWPAPGLHHDELSGRGGGGDRGRGEREDVVVGRQRRLAITPAATSIGIAAVYCTNRGHVRYLRMLSNSMAAAAAGDARTCSRSSCSSTRAAARTRRGSRRSSRPSASSTRPPHRRSSTSLLVVRQLLARELFSPAWISVGVLVWLGALAAAAGAALMWRNLATFALVLDAATATRADERARSCWRPSALLVPAAGAAAAPRGAARRAASGRRCCVAIVARRWRRRSALRGRGVPRGLERASDRRGVDRARPSRARA